MITIVDYQCGNLFSINKALKRLGLKSIVTNDYKVLEFADKIILPGVGNFKTGMNNLTNNGLVNTLTKKINKDKTPVLGICLGMQLLASFSEEGGVSGLNYVKAKIQHFRFENQNNLKIPHIGWNSVSHQNNNRLFNSINNSHQFYFVHSYHMNAEKQHNLYLSTTNYGYDFISAFAYEHLYGVQFHPEKSQDQGLQLIKNFCSI
tara:strand:- start:387 stop:1001 length:615 start_codon:yes stop_codon:yes gene_type:complete